MLICLLSDLTGQEFKKIYKLSEISTYLNTLFLHLGNNPSTAEMVRIKLFTTIDEIINLNESEIFQFKPEPEMDPEADILKLWSLYYFFVNIKKKRVVFLSFRAVSSQESRSFDDISIPDTLSQDAQDMDM